MTGGSDDDLLRALAGGGLDAFAVLFRRHQRFVYNVAFRRTASWSTAEDVTGVVFLELWCQRERVEPLNGSIRPWLAGVAANQARRVWRSRSRRADALGRLAWAGDDAARSHEADPADEVAARIDDERAMAALLDRLDALPEAHREVLTLWAWEQLSYDEIAVALAVPVGTELLVQECSQGNDAARMVGGFDGTGAQVCVGGGDYPAAAVTLDGRSCEAVDPGLRPVTDADLAELNRMRAIEAALLAAPEDCLTEEQPVAWAEHVVAAQDLGLDVEVTPQMPDGSPAPPGVTPPDSMAIPAPRAPGAPALERGQMVPTTIVTAEDAPPACFIARVDWTRPVIEIQGGWT